MARSSIRFISSDFWDYYKVTSLEPLEKLLLFYLMSNSLVNYEGKYEISNRRISFDTGLSVDFVGKTLEKLSAISMAKRDGKYIILLWIPDNNRDRGCQEYIKWRASVFNRDNYTCQICGARGCELNAHHIIRWADSVEKRYELDNGITLCKNCHKKQHFNKERT